MNEKIIEWDENSKQTNKQSMGVLTLFSVYSGSLTKPDLAS